ncbi:hypothetical protein IAU60_002697 [Kwoniella sp. DSM 27419]
MTTLPQHMASLGPSPSRNPFAKPKIQDDRLNGSFSRAALLPSIISPAKPGTTRPVNDSVVIGDKGCVVTPRPEMKSSASSSALRPRTAWRLLWRGGLEIGREGWRLDGITFFAQLSFPPATPSARAKEVNPFDVLSSGPAAAPVAIPPDTPTSPFTLPLAAQDTDLCLSLESMRGRKYLQVRGLVDLPEDELLEGEGMQDTAGGVQMSIAPDAPLLAAYFTGRLCRSSKLSSTGRTLNAIMIGLGDEGIDSTTSSTILVYGQKQDHPDGVSGQGILKLFVGKRKPPPPPASAKKVRPGEPLPRAPLFFPDKKTIKRATSIFSSRTLSRASSVSSIYHPPPPAAIVAPPIRHASSEVLVPAGSRSPGRRGEKRPRSMDDVKEGDRKRISGKSIDDRSASGGRAQGLNMERRLSSTATLAMPGDDDVFGKRASSVASTSASAGLNHAERDIPNGGEGAATEGGGTTGETLSVARSKRVKVPQQVLDNKGTIRKQALVLLEARGVWRTHDSFKDVFAMVTKGAYFAFRNHLESGPISKTEAQRIIAIHLDMYLPASSASALPTLPIAESPDTGVAADGLDDRVEEAVNRVAEQYDEVRLEGTLFHRTLSHTHAELEGRVKLEAVEEEDED